MAFASHIPELNKIHSALTKSLEYIEDEAFKGICVNSYKFNILCSSGVKKQSFQLNAIHFIKMELSTFFIMNGNTWLNQKFYLHFMQRRVLQI